MNHFTHVFPVNDLRPHYLHIGCWCSPTTDEQEPDVLVHSSMDGREHFETGERLPS